MNVSIILLALFCAIGGYFIGLYRGNETHKYDYDNGWFAAEEYFKRFPELVEEEDDEGKYDKARRMIRELDELFNEEDEDNNVIDGGEY